MMLLELLMEAGAPPGIVNVIHGTRNPVNFICDHPDIKAVSFVGSDIAVIRIPILSSFVRKQTRNTIVFNFRVNTSTNELVKMVNVFKAIWVPKITASFFQMLIKRER